MRFLIVLLLVVAGVVGLGFYRGWFDLTSARTDDKPAVTVTVDKDKMQRDAQKAQDKVQGQRTQDKGAALPANTKD